MGSGFFIVLLVMFAFLYLLLIRPQRQQQRRHAEMIKELGPGDEVITAGGIYGDVIEVEQPDRITLEIAEDVHIEVARRAIASVVPQEDAGSVEDELEDTTVEEPEPVVEERAEQEEARR